MKHLYWKRALRNVALAVMLCGGSAVRAQSGDAILDLLTKKGIITQREANEVREQLDKDAAAAVELHNKAKVSSFLDSMKWSGDLRLRCEHFDNGDQSGAGTDTIDRLRFRYRLRLGLEAQFPDWATIGLRLASGDGDPVSTNQSFTDTFKKKPISIDAVFVKLQPPGWDWLTVVGGKMDNVMWQPKFNSPMVYDGDVTPEGVAEQLSFKLSDEQQFTLFANFGQYVLKELSLDSSDPLLFDFQGGMSTWFLGNDAKSARLAITGAAGFYFTQNLANSGYAFGDSPNRGNANGVGALANSFLSDFRVFNARGEVAWLISEKPFLGTPAKLTIGGEYVVNLESAYETLANSQQTADPDQTQGWTVQIAFGEAKKRGQWQVAYQYKYLEADAVWDAIADSDWGTGGTDRKGHVIKAAYNVLDWWQLGFAAFLTEKISNRQNSAHNTVGSIHDEQNALLRIQVDSMVKF